MLIVKEEYMGQVIKVQIPGMGKVKINTDDIKGDKSFYINNGLSYLFEEVSILKDDWDDLISGLSDEAINYLSSINVYSYKDYLEFSKALNKVNIEDYVKSLNIRDEKVEVIEEIVVDEKVAEEAPKVVKKKGGRPRKKV